MLIILQKCCAKHSTVGTGNLFPSKRSPCAEPAWTYLAGGWGANHSSDSTARGRYQHCWHDKCKSGWLYALLSSHQFLSWNISHWTPVVSQKRTMWSYKWQILIYSSLSPVLITLLSSNTARWKPFTFKKKYLNRIYGIHKPADSSALSGNLTKMSNNKRQCTSTWKADQVLYEIFLLKMQRNYSLQSYYHSVITKLLILTRPNCVLGWIVTSKTTTLLN